jgi:putative aminopeptidase FrvX
MLIQLKGVDMVESLHQLYKDLTECNGVPGQERAVRKVMEKYLAGFVQFDQDNLGSMIAIHKKSSEGPKVMVAAHMDEIGFMVTDITEQGYLRFQNLGGWWEQVMLAQQVTVHTKKGSFIGVIGSKPPHILPVEDRKKVVQRKDMFIDIGVSSDEEARQLGVRLGDPITPICNFQPMGNPKYLLAKAWDDRAGCAAIVELLRTIQDHPNVLYGVGTVQEEVGLRGAVTSSNAVKPDIGIAIDVSIAGDTPGLKPEEAKAELGKGPTVLLYDSSMVAHLGFRDLVLDIAEEQGIPVQIEVMATGGTDAGRIHLFDRGVPSIVLSVPTRYIHSHAGIVHSDDMDNLIRLLKAVVLRLDAETVASLKQ